MHQFIEGRGDEIAQTRRQQKSDYAGGEEYQQYGRAVEPHSVGDFVQIVEQDDIADPPVLQHYRTRDRDTAG